MTATADPITSPMVTGFAEIPPPLEVWVVLVDPRHEDAEAEIYEVLGSDPGKDYARRLSTAWAVTRDQRAHGVVTVTKHRVVAPPWLTP